MDLSTSMKVLIKLKASTYDVNELAFCQFPSEENSFGKFF